MGLEAARYRAAPASELNPPAQTHPPHKASQTPTAHGMPGPTPEPSKGVEGGAKPNKPVDETAPTTTIKDQSPVPTTTT